MPLVLGSLFLTRWPRLDSTSAAVVAHSNVFSYVDSFLVHVANFCPVHVPHCGVIEEVPFLPAPAGKTVAEIAEPIINSTVEAHHRSPVPCVENKSRTAPAPVRRSPEVIVAVPSPVAWRPDIAIPWTDWLLVHGQFGRCKPDGNNDLRRSRTGHE